MSTEAPVADKKNSEVDGSPSGKGAADNELSSLAYFDDATPAPLSLKAAPDEKESPKAGKAEKKKAPAKADAEDDDLDEDEDADRDDDEDSDDDEEDEDDEPEARRKGSARRKAAVEEDDEDDLDDDLIDIAAKLGVDEDTLRDRGGGSAKQAERYLERIARRRDLLGDEDEDRGRRSKRDDDADEDAPADASRYAYKLDLDEDEVDEQTRKQLSKMNNHYARAVAQTRGENRALAQQVERLSSVIRRQSDALATNLFDSLVSTFTDGEDGETWKKLLGSGPTFAVKRGSKQWANRERLFRKYNTLLKAEGRKGNPLEAILDARTMVFKGVKPKKSKKSSGEDAGEASSIPRSTQRVKTKSAADNAKQQDIEEARKWMEGFNGQASSYGG